jgi:hypothetical protein
MAVCLVEFVGHVPAFAQSAADEALPRTVPLREAQDRNPDLNVVEIDLTAKVAKVPIGPKQSVDA